MPKRLVSMFPCKPPSFLFRGAFFHLKADLDSILSFFLSVCVSFFTFRLELFFMTHMQSPQTPSGGLTQPHFPTGALCSVSLGRADSPFLLWDFHFGGFFLLLFFFFFSAFLPFLPTKNTPRDPTHLLPVPPPVLWSRVSFRRVQPAGAQISPSPSMPRVGPGAQPDTWQHSGSVTLWVTGRDQEGFSALLGTQPLGFA